MESSNPLATESFSYSWLVDRKQHSHDVPTETISPTLPEKGSNRDHNFHFDVSLTPFHAALVHADEIFSHGHIMPVYADRAKVGAMRALGSGLGSVSPSPVSLYSMRSKKQWCLVEKWRRSSNRILQKCFGLIWPSKKNSRVDDLERKVFEVRSWSNSVQASPRPSKVISNGAALKKARSWGASPQASPRVTPARASSAWCGDESSIHEAILYCKRSIEK